jgi:hypothetical protein
LAIIKTEERNYWLRNLSLFPCNLLKIQDCIDLDLELKLRDLRLEIWRNCSASSHLFLDNLAEKRQELTTTLLRGRCLGPHDFDEFETLGLLVALASVIMLGVLALAGIAWLWG